MLKYIMNNEWIKATLLTLTITTLLTIAGFFLAKKFEIYQCESYSEATGVETKFYNLKCYFVDESGSWQLLRNKRVY